ncbi:MAG: Bax inhibitor-1 family protein [Bacilli bacterium]
MDVTNEQTHIGHDTNDPYTFRKDSSSQNKSSALSMGKVFAYLALGLGVTFVVCTIIGIFFNNWLVSDFDSAYLTLFGMMIGSIIVQLVLTLIMSIGINKAKWNLTAPYILYAVTMGVMLSTFTIFLPWEVLSISVGVTTLLFGVLALIGIFSKSNLHPLLFMAFGLFIGGALIVGLNFLMAFLLPGVWDILCWIVSIVFFAALMFVTIFDVWQIKKITQNGSNSKNLSLWCAYRLYLDYIAILIRVLYFVLVMYAKNKN